MTAHPASIQPLLSRLGDMVDGGRLAGARALLAAVKSQSGDTAAVMEIEACLLMREGRNDDAIALLDTAIARSPESATLRARRAEARFHANDQWGAAADAAEAVILDPTSVGTKALLGISLIELGRHADAAACLNEALGSRPDNADYRRALATALERDGQGPAAADVLFEGMRRTPGDPSLRTAAIMQRMRERRFQDAADIADAARHDGVVDACILGLYGHALSSLGHHERASEMYREALKLGPEDPYVRHLVTASGVMPGANRAPAAYLETVFDGYAARFEAHLISLGYRVPGLIRSTLFRHRPETATLGIPALLDLGCGTGLIGVVLSDVKIDSLVGLDISSRMLEEAKSKGIYTEVVHDELENFVGSSTRSWPVVVAADVFCYFGAIDHALHLIHAHLEPNGLLVFSVESLPDPRPDEPWRLGRLGRYAHTNPYINAAATNAGFEIVGIDEDVLRFEGEAPVEGLIVTLRRRHDA